MGEPNVNFKDVKSFLNSRLGINLYKDPYQQKYVRAMIAPTEEVQGIFIDAAAGTGKTSLAISVAYLLLEKDLIDQIVYVRNAVSIRDLGFLPGDVAEKEAPYMQPGLDALSKVDPKNPTLIDTLITNEQLVIVSTTFLRGVDWDGRKLLIIDEAQNLNLKEMQTVLTRPHDSTKVIVIGSSLQCDEGIKCKRYGQEQLLPFQLFAEHFSKYTDLNVLNLTLKNNYRGKFSQLADEIDKTIKYLDLKEEERLGAVPNFNEEDLNETAKLWEEVSKY